jgi:peptidoglycan/xylan/chitin deacetylase (PgdA/CDA1 family)
MRRTILYSAAALAGAALVASAFLINYQSPSTALSSTSNVVVTNFQPDHGFIIQSGAGSQADDLSTFALGEQSLRITTEGDGTPVFTRKALSPPLNFTDRFLKVWVKVDSVDSIRELRISATGDDFRTWTDYWIAGSGADASFLQDDKWNVVTLSLGQARAIGDPDTSRIDSIQVRVADSGTGVPVTVWLNGIALVAKNDRAIVTFAFDDGYESDYTMARPVLDKYHFPATSYVIGSLVGGQGRLSIEQLKNLQDLNGWDIASHSFTHSNLTERARPEIESDLQLSQQFLERNGLHRGAKHFAYPYGEFDNEDLRSLVQKYFATARTGVGPGETLPPSDPYRLRVMMVANTTSFDEVTRQVQAATAGGDWLILVFHRIADSNPIDDLEYAQADFERIVDDVASRGVEVLTVSEVYSRDFR